MDDARHAGFSLFELLVTLALAALLAGLAIPASSRFIDNSRLRSAAEALSRELQHARSHALAHGQETRFSVTSTGTGWCYGWSDGPACDCHLLSPAASACTTGHAAARRSHRWSSMDHPRIGLRASRVLLFSPVRGTATAASFTISNRYDELRVILSPLGRVRICSASARTYTAC